MKYSAKYLVFSRYISCSIAENRLPLGQCDALQDQSQGREGELSLRQKRSLKKLKQYEPNPLLRRTCTLYLSTRAFLRMVRLSLSMTGRR